jgi:Holliday junction resolvasome RuvABC DNA-binding subunit
MKEELIKKQIGYMRQIAPENLKESIELLEKVLAVGGKMPEKIMCKCENKMTDYHLLECQKYERENKAIDARTLAFASMGLSVAELMEIIADNYNPDSITNIGELATAIHKAWEGKVRDDLSIL